MFAYHDIKNDLFLGNHNNDPFLFLFLFFFVLAGSDSESYHSENDALLTNEDKRIADLGRPQLGEITRMEVRIMESTEFKVRLSHIITGNWLMNHILI